MCCLDIWWNQEWLKWPNWKIFPFCSHGPLAKQHSLSRGPGRVPAHPSAAVSLPASSWNYSNKPRASSSGSPGASCPLAALPPMATSRALCPCVWLLWPCVSCILPKAVILVCSGVGAPCLFISMTLGWGPSLKNREKRRQLTKMTLLSLSKNEYCFIVF